MGINVWPRGAAVRGAGSVLGQTPAPAELRTWPTSRAGSPRSANLKARGGLGRGGGAKDLASRELWQDGLHTSALVTWGKAEGQSDSCQHPGQGRGRHQARAPSRSASGPVPQPPLAQGPPAPTSPGGLPPMAPRPLHPGAHPACPGKAWNPPWLRDPDYRLFWQPQPWARPREAEVRPATLEPSSHWGLELSGS